jgi:hypothetical protein
MKVVIEALIGLLAYIKDQYLKLYCMNKGKKESLGTIAVNLDGVAVSTKINFIEASVTFISSTQDYSSSRFFDEEIKRMHYEALFCRLVDLLNDVTYRFTISAIKKIDFSDLRISHAVSAKLKKLLKSSGDKNQCLVEYFENRFSRDLKELRVTAKKLDLPFGEDLESLIQIRNSFVHNASKPNELLEIKLQYLESQEIYLDISDGIILPNHHLMTKAIEAVRLFIHNSEEVLHSEYKIPWTYFKNIEFERIKLNI